MGENNLKISLALYIRLEFSSKSHVLNFSCLQIEHHISENFIWSYLYQFSNKPYFLCFISSLNDIFSDLQVCAGSIHHSICSISPLVHQTQNERKVTGPAPP